ncbi:MAG: helix-turn-helix domain-containing protein [Streptosporangiaceae bacterium]|nr:helix-turn-helix domain-containing protein [Streptosporangiaceae bacterium]
MKDTDNDQPVTLGAYIRAGRERANFSLRNVEQVTGIPRNTLHRLEVDEIDKPDARMLGTLANALELKVADLLAFIGMTPSQELPSLAPYLRAKYKLPPDAAAEADTRIREILDRYDDRSERTG